VASGNYVYSSTENVVAVSYPGLPSTSIALNTAVAAGTAVAADTYATKVVLAQGATAITGDTSLASVTDNVVTITNTTASEVTVLVTGSLTAGYLAIPATSTGAIKLILDGVGIANATAGCCPIYDLGTGGLTLEVNEGSVNYLNDTRTASKAPKGVIYAKTDLLTFAGKGTLSLQAAITNGINAAGGIKVTGDLTLDVTSYANAVKTDNEFIATGAPTFNLKTTYEGHGISADKGITVSGNGTYNIVTIDGCTTDNTATSGSNVTTTGLNYSVGGGAGLKTDGDMTISAGNFNITTAGGATSSHYDPNDDDTTNDAVNTKGLKAGDGDTSGTGGNINITGGVFNINSRDDAIHASGYLDTSTYAWEDGTLSITGGTVFIATGDDAIHGDGAVTIDDTAAETYIDITACYEGLEGVDINYQGGTTYLVASDDGVNAASKDITNLTSSYYGYSIDITGGYLSVDSSGDGLDSNGDITISGGLTVVSGPAGAGDGELDIGDSSSCKFTQNGGTLVAYGSGGQMDNFTATGTQCTAYLGSIDFDKGEYVVVADANGEVVLAVQAMKDAASFYISSPFLTTGTYNLYVTSTLTGGSEVFANAYFLTSASTAALTYGSYDESATVSFTSASAHYSSGSTGGFNGGGGMGPGGR
jgi:hypothetical protein